MNLSPSTHGPTTPPWFKLSADILKPLITKRNVTQSAHFSAPTASTKAKFKHARSIVKQAVKIARLKWLEIQTDQVKDINLHPKQAWDTTKKLRQGLCYHHMKPRTYKLKSDDGTLSKNDKEHAEIFGRHFKKVFSRQDITFDASVLNDIKNRATLIHLDNKFEYTELQLILRKMQNHKAAGPNNLPMDALNILALKYSILDLDHPNAQPIAFVYHLLSRI